MASKSILVPLDGSSFAERAIPLAAWYSVATGSGVRFIHVLAAETEPTERSRAADLFQTYASRVSSKAGLSTADCEVLVGSPHEEVVAASVTAAAHSAMPRYRPEHALPPVNFAAQGNRLL